MLAKVSYFLKHQALKLIYIFNKKYQEVSNTNLDFIVQIILTTWGLYAMYLEKKR